ncbi:MAG: DNA-directed RNA polymerase subunit beta' [Candidatus Tagabacteria bacterium]
MDTKVTDFKSIMLKLASPEKILSWSKGEVTKAETINYRTQRAERDGLFDERIFGPEKDYECYCGKYRRIRYKGIVCEKCGVEVTRSIVRRERMGHVTLASPVTHIWFFRGLPSVLGSLLDLSVPDLEKVIYFASYIVTKVNEKIKLETLLNLDKEYKARAKNLTEKNKKISLKEAFDKSKSEINEFRLNKVISEIEYHRLSLKYGDIFEAEIGSEALYNICKKINLQEMKKSLITEAQNTSNPQLQKKLLKRISLIKAMEGTNIRPEWMFLTALPIIPPAFRPMVQLDGGRHATSDVNDLYRRVINRNNRLKKLLELKAPEVITRNEKRMLQESVDALIDNSIRRGQAKAVSQAQRRPLRSLADMLKGKQGRFRQNLLGKRVDYSGRSVIVVGPELKMHQCGLPKHMALELFRPFVISQLIKRELAYNVRGAGRLIDEATSEVWAILEEVIKDKYVLLNRAPTLHRLGIQAFQPILIEGNAIQIHPLVCTAFNADFDGDQMAVHVPLSEAAQKEAKEIMASVKNLLGPGTGEPIVNPSQDIVFGCYWMTKIRAGTKGEGKIFSSPNEAIMAYDFGFVDLQAEIKALITPTPKYRIFSEKIILTTVGRLLFNSVLPSDFEFINEELNKKKIAEIVKRLIDRYGMDATPPILDKIKDFGYQYATASGISWGINDLVEPKEKEAIVSEAMKREKEVEKHYNNGLLTAEERYDKIIEIWQEVKQKISSLVPETLDEFGPVKIMVSSAARGSWDQVNQMAGMKGLVVNPAGKIIDLPIISSYKKGLNVLEYFISTHGARKGTTDTALKTAKAGYLTRRLVDVAQDLIIREADCQEKKGFLLSRVQVEEQGDDFAKRLISRTLSRELSFLAADKEKKIFKRNHILNAAEAELIKNSEVAEIYLRSPITCQSIRGVCQMCYGNDLGSGSLIKLGEAIGIIAAQAIGEPGTQLTMRTFHVGGVAGGGDITLGLPRVEEVFELRTPSNPAIVSEVGGKVLEIKNLEQEKIVRILTDYPESKGKKKQEVKEYIIPFGKVLAVKEGDEIKPGDVLCSGSIDIKYLYNIASTEAIQNYILNEVGKIYALQGAPINKKHIEVIVRQMFSRYRIREVGDSYFGEGEVVERSDFLEENNRLEKEKKMPAKASYLVMPISKVALSTSSFLSAASFQDTARVLIKASIRGARDYLRGLKENVIIGRLIPAGTGFRKEFHQLLRTEEEEKDLL